MGAARRRRRRAGRAAARAAGRAPGGGGGRPRRRAGGVSGRVQAGRRGRGPGGVPGLGGGRSRQDHGGRGGGAGRVRRRARVCCSGTARRTSPLPTSCSPKRSATSSPTPPRSSSSRTSSRGGRSWPGWSRRCRAGCPGSGRRRRRMLTPSGTRSSPRWSGCWSWCREQQPVVLVLDDLQWADRASLQLLRHVVAADQPMRLLVSGTYRDTELSRSHPLVETLGGAASTAAGSARFELAGLDDAGVVSLMEAAAGHTLDDAGRASRPGGASRDRRQPVLRQRGAAPPRRDRGDRPGRRTGRWVAAAPLDAMALPASVRTVIGARVGRLGPDAERVLSLAAVIGRDFDLDVLARASRRRRTTTCSTSSTRRPPRRWSASSPTRPGTTTSPTPSSNTRCTRTSGPPVRPGPTGRWPRRSKTSAATAPGPRSASWPATGRATQPADLAKALDYSRRAGDAALAALAPGDALRYYTQALDLYARSDDPDPILGIDLADRARHRATPDRRRRIPRHPPRRRPTGRRPRRHRTARGRRPGQQPGHVLRRRDHRHRQGRDPGAGPRTTLRRRPRPGARARHALRRAHLRRAASSVARHWPTRPSPSPESTGDDATIVRVLNDISFPLAVPQLLEQSLAWSAEALDRAERLGDPVLLFWAARSRRRCRSAPGTSTRWTAAARSPGRSPSGSTSRS